MRKSTHLAIVPLVLLLVAAPLSRAADPKAPAKAFMWKVTSDTTTLYLMGSVHVASDDMYPLAKEVEDAFTASSLLVVEVDTTKLDQAQMMQVIQEKGMFKAPATLSNSIGKPAADALKAYCETNKLPVEMFDRFKPWMAGLTIQFLSMQKMGLDPNKGIDKHFLDAAHAKKMKVAELETADFQLTTISSFADDVQEKFLESALIGAKDQKDDIDKLRTAWKEGDAAGMQEQITKSVKEKPELKIVMTRLIDDRNVGMAKKIDAYLKGKDQIFVVVGAAHMVGDKGIVKLLEDKKYKVEQITIAPPK